VRPLLIGERRNRPSAREWDALEWATACVGDGAFDEADGVKLARIGLSLDACDRLNVHPPGSQGDPWDADLAARVATRLVDVVAERPVVYVAGGLALAAVSAVRRGNPLAEVYGRTVHAPALGRPVVPVPHPSGLNRWWNDPRRVAALRDLLSETVLGGTACRRS